MLSYRPAPSSKVFVPPLLIYIIIRRKKNIFSSRQSVRLSVPPNNVYIRRAQGSLAHAAMCDSGVRSIARPGIATIGLGRHHWRSRLISGAALQLTTQKSSLLSASPNNKKFFLKADNKLFISQQITSGKYGCRLQPRSHSQPNF